MFQLTELLAGIGLFLFAMHFLEISLKELSGRKFKLFLQKVAARPLSAVAGSALITGSIQRRARVHQLKILLPNFQSNTDQLLINFDQFKKEEPGNQKILGIATRKRS
ncbi:MAG: hypothetical protein ACKOOA_00495 [Sediminibacterium sp.]